MAIDRPPLQLVEAPAPQPASDGPADARKEKRAGPRRRVLFGGKIVFALGARSIDCTIRDLSEAGAQVRLAAFELLPEEVYLIELRRGLAHEARVAWVRPPHLGLQFVRSHLLAEAPPSSEFGAMRRLWLEHVPRSSP